MSIIHNQMKTEATFKCGQCDIAQFAVLRTISHNLSFSAQYRTIHRSSHIFAQFTILRNFLHNFMLKNQLYYFNLYSQFDFGRVDTMKWGELIPWPGASWYHDLGRVDTGVTRCAWHWGELIPWPGASWYHDLGRVDTGVTRGACYWGELIPWPGASWYQDLGRLDTKTWGELIPNALRSW
jgi:hypothetical protein